MKAIFTLLAVAAVALVSCKDDNKGKLDPNAMISIRAAQGVPSGKAETANPKHLTAREIVEQAAEASFLLSDGRYAQKYIPDNMRDLETNRLLMYATEAIESTGELELAFIECTDWVFRTQDENFHPIDTIAYIPNGLIREIEKKIKAAYAKGDYAACYQILDTDVRFTPITGAEWRALKAKNEN